jgi:Tfp pilus assembly protein PilO
MGGPPHHLQATEGNYDEAFVEKDEACLREIKEGRQDLRTSFATMDRWFPTHQELNAFCE